MGRVTTRRALYVGLAAELLSSLGCQTHQRLVRQDEHVIVNDLRAILAAQNVYSGSNCGFADILRVLRPPRASLIPKMPSAVTLGGAWLLRTATDGDSTWGQCAFSNAAPPLLSRVCSLGVHRRACRASWRAEEFLCDSSGRVCANLDGVVPQVTEGQCATPCERLASGELPTETKPTKPSYWNPAA
jgi:hypothetical protein